MTGSNLVVTSDDHCLLTLCPMRFSLLALVALAFFVASVYTQDVQEDGVFGDVMAFSWSIVYEVANFVTTGEYPNFSDSFVAGSTYSQSNAFTISGDAARYEVTYSAFSGPNVEEDVIGEIPRLRVAKMLEHPFHFDASSSSVLLPMASLGLAVFFAQF